MSIQPNDAIPTTDRPLRTVSQITVRCFPIFPDLYLFLPWSQFPPVRKVQPAISNRLIARSLES